MQPWGGFEHNLQSLRVVDELEDKYAAFPGLNLSFETREGILKHCSRRNARALGELGERFLQRSWMPSTFFASVTRRCVARARRSPAAR